MRAHVDNLAVFVLFGVREDHVSEKGIILSPGPPAVCLARRDELLDTRQPVAAAHRSAGPRSGPHERTSP